MVQRGPGTSKYAACSSSKLLSSSGESDAPLGGVALQRGEAVHCLQAEQEC